MVQVACLLRQSICSPFHQCFNDTLSIESEIELKHNMRLSVCKCKCVHQFLHIVYIFYGNTESNQHQNITQCVTYHYQIQSSASSSSSSMPRRLGEFEQQIPRHSPQLGVHCNPCFLQLHRLLSQSDLQLHLIIVSSLSGAGGRSVVCGTYWPWWSLHPHSSGLRLWFPIQSWTCR